MNIVNLPKRNKECRLKLKPTAQLNKANENRKFKGLCYKLENIILT